MYMKAEWRWCEKGTIIILESKSSAILQCLCNTAASTGPILRTTTQLFYFSSPPPYCTFISTMSIYYRQRNIVNLFSFDTFANIFGRVARNDILQCILTCRQWRHVVPHYASSCFRHLVLEGKQDPMEYSILLEQVCGYAKVVVLDQCSFFLSRSGLPVAMPYFFSNVTTLRKWIHARFQRTTGA